MMWRNRPTSRSWWLKCRLLLTAALLIVSAAAARAEVELPNGRYFENVVELPVKVLGGELSMIRTWYQGQWHFGRAWSPLAIEYDSEDGSIRSITRNEQVYARKSGANKSAVIGVYELDVRHRIAHIVGPLLRWQEIGGNFAEYDIDGRILRTGTPDNVITTFEHEEDRLTRVRDHHGNVILRIDYNTDGRIERVRDPDDREVLYNYTAGRLTQVIDVLGNSWSYTYDSNGRIRTSTDAEGRKQTIDYHTSGRVKTVTDSDNDVTRYSYDYDSSQGTHYVKLTSPAGRTMETTYDRDGIPIRQALNGREFFSLIADGRKQIVTDRSGNRTVYEYDEWDNLAKTTYPDGTVESARYLPGTIWPLESIDENGVRTAAEYDSAGNLILLTEAVGLPEERSTEIKRDEFGQIEHIRRLPDSRSLEAIRQFTYDQFGNLETYTDAENNLTTYDYDTLGNALKLTDARNKIWLATFDDGGRLLTETYPGEGSEEDRTTHYDWDKVGNLKAITEADDTQTQFHYDAKNRLELVIDAKGGRYTYKYDPDGNVVEEIDESGEKVVSKYDDDGRLIEALDGTGQAILTEYKDDAAGMDGLPWRVRLSNLDQEFVYDRRNRPTGAIDRPRTGEPLTQSVKYDPTGNVREYIDAKNRKSGQGHDALNRPILFEDAGENSTKYSFDNRDNVVGTTDPKIQTTQYSYDRENRLRNIVRPLTQTISFEYDPTGNVKKILDANGDRIEVDYDDSGRRIREWHYRATQPTVPERSIIYKYDQVDNLIEYDDGVTSALYEYDALDQLESATVNYGSFSLTHRYTYYENGLKKTYTSPDDVTVTFGYDANRLHTISIPGQGTVTVNEYDWDSPSRFTLPGGTTSDLEIDDLRRLVGIATTDPAGNPVMNRGYTYDPAGNITRRESEDGVFSYDYDAVDRLTLTEHSYLPPESFEYDSIGNRVRLNAGDPWVYDENNRLLTHDGVNYGYDENGNRILRTESGLDTHYQYDLLDQLESVSDHEQQPVARYYHDPFGYRLWRESNGTRTYFHYSDEGLAGEYDASGTLVQSYGYAPDSMWSTAPVFVRSEGTYGYYLNDVIGTPQKILAPTGAELWKANYAPFGKASTSAFGIDSPLRFAGQQQDPDTNLHYNHLRDYDPTTGRYLQVDPEGLSASPTLYAYAGSNPAIHVDPHGDVYGSLLRSATARAGAMLRYGTIRALNACKYTAACLKTTKAIGRQFRKLTQRGKSKRNRAICKQAPSGSRAAKPPDKNPASSRSPRGKKKTDHKNRLDYVGDVHVYRLRGSKGTYKVGESARGVRKRDGNSIRAEDQVRKAQREGGEILESKILKKRFNDKRSAVNYQDRLRDRFRRRYGKDTLPGNREHLRGRRKSRN